MRSTIAFILIVIASAGLAQENLTELYASLKPSVVTIMTNHNSRGRGAIGSGVAIDLDGHFMTAAHVTVIASDPKQHDFLAERQLAPNSETRQHRFC